ncbi:unnamed protein product [Prorocentrum cordatum]|uniref:Uncharacterized protein n=1 Tax=Prorocentrum cordatum TaxID=2364126 RepID=A0ABN9Y3C9_9DINO|nr:unnamed protein product [Polarella glacialis]
MVLPLPVWQLREPRMNWRNKCQTHSFTKQRARRARAALSGGEAPVRHARAGGGEGGRRRRRRRRRRWATPLGGEQELRNCTEGAESAWEPRRLARHCCETRCPRHAQSGGTRQEEASRIQHKGTGEKDTTGSRQAWQLDH